MRMPVVLLLMATILAFAGLNCSGKSEHAEAQKRRAF